MAIPRTPHIKITTVKTGELPQARSATVRGQKLEISSYQANARFTDALLGNVHPNLKGKFSGTTISESQGTPGKLPSPAISNGSPGPAKGKAPTRTSGDSQGTLVATLRKNFMAQNTKKVAVGNTNFAGRGTLSRESKHARRGALRSELFSPLPEAAKAAKPALLSGLPEAPKLALQSEQPPNVKAAHALSANVRIALNALDTAINAGTHSQDATRTKEEAVLAAKSTASIVAINSPGKNILPHGPHTSENAMRLSKLTASLNLATGSLTNRRSGNNTEKKSKEAPSSLFSNKKSNGDVTVDSAKKGDEADIFGMRFNNANFTQTPIQQGTPKKRKQKQKADNSYITLANVRRGLPEGANLSGNGIRKSRAEAGLPSAPRIKRKFLKNLNQESNTNRNTNTKGTAMSQLVIAAAPQEKLAPAPAPAPAPVPAPEPEAPKLALVPAAPAPEAPKLALVPAAPAPEAPKLALVPAGPQGKQDEPAAPAPEIPKLAVVPEPPPLSQKNMSTRADRKKAAREQLRQGPFENPNNIFRLAQEQGFRPQIAPNSFGIAKTVRRKKVGKKTMKKIIYNSEQKQILLRKIKKAEAAAKSGPSFFTKFLGGFGFYPKEGENAKQYIEGLYSKIEKIDNNIAKGQRRLDTKRANVQNNATMKNLKAKQKAINRTKYYRDLMAQYYIGETTGEIEVKNTHRNTNEAKAIRKERAEKKITPKNILATNANLGNNMRMLFNNTAATKKNSATANATALALKTETPTAGPLVPRINTATNTKGGSNTISKGAQPVNTTKTSRTHREILGISANAPLEEVKKAYKRLALQLHPNKVQGQQSVNNSATIKNAKNKAQKQFTEMQEAYSALMKEMEK